MPLTSPGIPRSLRSRPFRPRRKGLGFLRCGDWRCLPSSAPGIPRSLRSPPLTLREGGWGSCLRRNEGGGAGIMGVFDAQ